MNMKERMMGTHSLSTHRTRAWSIPETSENLEYPPSPKHDQTLKEMQWTYLPTFTPVPEAEFQWGEIEGRNFTCALYRIIL